MGTPGDRRGEIPGSGARGQGPGPGDPLERFLRGMDVALIEIASDRRIEGWRGSATEMFGRPEHLALGRTPVELEIERGGLLGLVRETIEAGCPIERDLALWRTDGTRFQARVRATASDPGDLERLQLLVTDLTSTPRSLRRRGSERQAGEAFVAELSRLALEWQDVDRVCERATMILRELVDPDMIGVFRRFGDGPQLELVAGSGWPVEVGHRVRGNDLELAYLSGGSQPTLLLGLAKVDELPADGLIARSEARMGLAVSIGPIGRGFGSLVILDRGSRDFSPAEINLAASIALVIDAAATRDLASSLEGQVRRISHLESLTKLSGGIAQEFNNLLGVITNHTEIARADIGAGDVGRIEHSLDEISGAADRAVELTDQLLMFGRRDSGKSEALDLAEAIEALREPLERELGGAATLALRTEGDLPAVKIGERQFAHMLVSLTSNARHAMPSGGVLRIELGPAAEESDRAPGVRLVVADDGVGMTAEVRERAFEPFFTTRPVGEGSGLGLPTVYGAVTGAGGSIDLSSRPGEGTEITIELPAASAVAGYGAPRTDSRAWPGSGPPPSRAELSSELARGTSSASRLTPERDRPPVPTDPGESGDGSPDKASSAAPEDGATILIVEDDDMVRRLTERMLREAGHKVHVATGAREALAEVRDGGLRPDLVLTDVVMPEMTGVELVHELSETVPDVTVAFMSGYTSDTISEDVLDHGGELIEKPFTPASLLGGVQRALGADGD